MINSILNTDDTDKPSVALALDGKSDFHGFFAATVAFTWRPLRLHVAGMFKIQSI